MVLSRRSTLTALCLLLVLATSPLLKTSSHFECRSVAQAGRSAHSRPRLIGRHVDDDRGSSEWPLHLSCADACRVRRRPANRRAALPNGPSRSRRIHPRAAPRSSDRDRSQPRRHARDGAGGGSSRSRRASRHRRRHAIPGWPEHAGEERRGGPTNGRRRWKRTCRR